MTRGPAIVAATLAGIALLVAGLAGAQLLPGHSAAPGGPRDSVATDGPLAAPGAHGWAVVATPGTAFTDGLETLPVTGTAPVTITDVQIVGDDNLELVGALVAYGRPGEGTFQHFSSYPPHRAELGTVVPAAGAVITPGAHSGRGAELLLGLRLTSPGRAQRDEVVIRYLSGGQPFEVHFPALLAVCSPASDRVPGRCAPPS